MKADRKLATPCGSFCGECSYFGEKCAGCGYSGGKPFWGECRFYLCTKERNLEHCGFCNEFPCDYYLKAYDLSEGVWRVFYRAGQLTYRKKIGTDAWLQGKIRGENPDPKYKK
jgi:hypothetical protein